MFSPESKLHLPTGKLEMPALPGLQATENPGGGSNPFSGIRRTGSAKRSQDLAKFQGKAGAVSAPAAPNAQFDGSKYQMQGGQAKTQFGAMRQAKF